MSAFASSSTLFIPVEDDDEIRVSASEARRNQHIVSVELSGKALPPWKIQGTSDNPRIRQWGVLQNPQVVDRGALTRLSPHELPFERFEYQEEQIVFYGVSQTPNADLSTYEIPYGTIGFDGPSTRLTVGLTGTLGSLGGIGRDYTRYGYETLVKNKPGESDAEGISSVVTIDTPVGGTRSKDRVSDMRVNKHFFHYGPAIVRPNPCYSGDILRDGLSTTAVLASLSEQFPVFGFAHIPENILNDIEYLEGYGGPLIVRVLIGGTVPRDLMCWVNRVNLYDGVDDSGLPPDNPLDVNCTMAFPVRGGLPIGRIPVSGEYRNERHAESTLYYYSLHSQDEAFRLLTDRFSTYLYSAPQWGINQGYPRSIKKVGGRVFYAGFNSNEIYYSSKAPQSPFGLNVYLPQDSNIVFDEGIAQKLRENNAQSGEGGGFSSLLPNPIDGGEGVYWYWHQIQGAFGLSPGGGEVTIGGGNAVNWVEVVRGVLVGTTTGERVIDPEVLDFGGRGVQSFRGSGLSITAKGDYALFFVGRNKRDIFYMFYDDGVSGFRSKLATRFAPDFDGDVKEMVWDNEGRCLWVLLETGKIFKFFLSLEYNIEGWSRVTFDSDFLLHPKHLIERNNEIGIISRKYDPSNPNSRDSWQTVVFRDRVTDGDDDGLIRAKVNIFKMAPPGQMGESSGWHKKVSRTQIKVRNTRWLRVQGERKAMQSATGVETVRVDIPLHDQIPLLEIEHRDNQRGEILATRSKLEIIEE